jgi:hypothetical protein
VYGYLFCEVLHESDLVGVSESWKVATGDELHCPSGSLDLTPFTDDPTVHRIRIDFFGATTAVLATQFMDVPGELVYTADLVDRSYADCARISPDELIKSPRSYDGTCIGFFGSILQYDSLTGPCAFLANISNQRSTRSYDYIELAWFGLGSSPNVYEHVQTCGFLDGVDQNDIIEVWAVGAGTFSYQNSLGGTATVPALSILRVDIIKKA